MCLTSQRRFGKNMQTLNQAANQMRGQVLYWGAADEVPPLPGLGKALKSIAQNAPTLADTEHFSPPRRKRQEEPYYIRFEKKKRR
jgi:hypothetical protein